MVDDSKTVGGMRQQVGYRIRTGHLDEFQELLLTFSEVVDDVTMC